MFDKLVKVICNYVEVEPQNIHLESRFMEDLGFTSFDFMSMLGEIEDEFDIEFDIENMTVEKFESLHDLCDYVQSNSQNFDNCKTY